MRPRPQGVSRTTRDSSVRPWRDHVRNFRRSYEVLDQTAAQQWRELCGPSWPFFHGVNLQKPLTVPADAAWDWGGWRGGWGGWRRSRAWARRPPLRTTPTMVAVIRITATDTIIRALSPCLCVRPARHPGTCALRELAPVKTSAPSHRAHIIVAPAKRLSPERGSPSFQVLMVRVAAVISPSVM